MRCNGMKESVGKHITRLQLRLERLHREIMQNGLTLQQRNQIDAEIRAAKLALEHFNAALDVEGELPRRSAG